MTLRPPQATLQDLCLQIRDGARIDQIIEAVAPGGGKSKMPVIAASHLVPEFADSLLWVVPRNSLKEQGEAEFLDPRMPTSRRLRAAQGNEPDPARGYDGYITTYQAIGTSPRAHLDFVRGRRTIAVFDEDHHVADDARWGEALAPIRDAARLIIDMSGTLSRHDGRPILGMQYTDDGVVDLRRRPGVEVIQYTRGQALRDGNILPVELVTIDGAAEWISKEGVQLRVESLRGAGESRADAVFTALRTDFAFQVIREALGHWEAHLAEYPAARMLVVAPDIETAQTYLEFLRRTHPAAEIATSDDGPAAARAIRDFKRGVIPILVTVGMAYEGLSVPEVTHLVCLTQIRSKEWLEQMQARGNRCAPGKRQSWCFAPADRALIEAWRAIESEALTPLGEAKEGRGAGMVLVDGEGPGFAPAQVEPLWSTAHGLDQAELAFRPSNLAPSVAEAQLRLNIRDLRKVVVDGARAGSRQALATVWNATVRSVADKDLDHMGVEELVEVWKRLREKFRGRW